MNVRARGAAAGAAALVLGLTAGGTTAYADDMDPKEIYERSAPGTVHVLGKLGSGTGFVYDADRGLIATAAHVVQGEAALKAVVGDRPAAPVRVVGIDPCQDLAVLAFTSPQSDLKALEFGDSKDLQAADTVVALGYPASLGSQGDTQKPAFTSGSVQNPDVQNAEPSTSLPVYPSTIQHSATVNPGNSGGPLLNADDKVVGINVLSVTGDTQGQFYSITSDHARPILDSLAAGQVKNDPGWYLKAIDDPTVVDDFAAEYQSDVQARQKKLVDAQVTGVLVVGVSSNSPAAKADLAPMDAMTTMKDSPVASVGEVCDVLQSSGPGETIPLDGVYTFDDPNESIKFGDPWTTNLVLGKNTATSGTSGTG
ncbi:S1C family serine protease [Streptomyces showdoensis]|uniref:Trypsin n=1 Tax=Streptomyces showdoensis TaxID=68268 RepID=A0A2P2GEK5_STREW|nr:trypsin-like peptidase domain-containing protein [Streptomyces showdoensis]KKZ69279.1 trypsin [Streptomyces showdoensis]